MKGLNGLDFMGRNVVVNEARRVRAEVVVTVATMAEAEAARVATVVKTEGDVADGAVDEGATSKFLIIAAPPNASTDDSGGLSSAAMCESRRTASKQPCAGC